MMGAEEERGGRRVADDVREAAMRFEPDRYIAATLAPMAAQAGLAAVAAFASEVARIPSLVSEPMLGEIRLQWWRDALAAGRQGVASGHPVADAVCAAERRHGLDPGLMLAMIDARELDLSGGLPSDDEGLFAYLEKTEGHPFRLAAQVLGGAGATLDDAARAAARAYGLARALSRLPMLFHNGGLPLTGSRLREAGLEPDGLAATPRPEGSAEAIARVTAELGKVARVNVEDARRRIASLARPLRVAFLPVAMVETYLKVQSASDPLLTIGVVSPLRRVLRLGAAHVVDRFRS